jgi:hypothetical protein
MKKLLISLTLIFCLSLGASLAYAQEAKLTLSMRRDFGYSSGTGRIQGLFSLTAAGPEDLTRVTFLMDGESFGEDAEAPFKIQFDTGQFSLGEHVISARGTTSDGSELASNEIRATFTPADEGMKVAGGIILPILGLVVGIMALSFVVSMASSRRKGTLPLGTPRNYGMQGGTICKKCGRPFALHVFKVNLLMGALDFCPHCGKWGVVRRLPLEVLRQAEANELQWEDKGEQVKGMTEEEKLRKDLEDSRFQGS